MLHPARMPVQRSLIAVISSAFLILGLASYFSPPATAATTGSISGRVTATIGGAGLKDVSVEVYTLIDGEWEWDDLHGADTLADGSYTVTGLPAGTYRVGFTDYDGNYLDEYWKSSGNVDDVDLAGNVVVGSADVAGINASLEKAGHITGSVTGAGGAMLADIGVDVYIPLNFQGETIWIPVYGTRTEEDGTYDVGGLPAGDYRIGFVDDNEPTTYVAEFWNDAPDVDSANTITLGAGQTSSGKNAALVVGGHIKGNVKAPSGTPLRDADVTAYHQRSDGTWVEDDYTYTYSDASGDYDLGGVSDGPVRIVFDYTDSHEAQPYQSQAWNNKPSVEQGDTIVISGANTVTGKDAKLGYGSHLKGKVTKPGGAAAPDVVVDAYRKAPGTSYWEPVSWTQTNASGYYDLAGLRAGTYRLGFGYGNTEYVAEYYNNKPTIETALDIAVPASTTVSGKNAEIALAGSISGKVTKTGTTTGIGSIAVEAYRLMNGSWESVPGVSTFSNGNYWVGSLQPGTYRVSFTDEEMLYAIKWFGNALSIETAKNVVVTSGKTTSGINVGLDKAGTISGTVTLPPGSWDGPERQVAVYRAGTDQLAGRGYADPENGNAYSVPGLASGGYRVEFGRTEGTTTVAGEFYDNQPDGETGKAAAKTVVVGTGKIVSGINATLGLGGDLEGTIVDGAGVGVGNCYVSVFGPDESFAARVDTTDMSGHFDATGLSSGAYLLKATCGDSTRYYTGPDGVMTSSEGAAAATTATIGSTTTLPNDLVFADPLTITNAKAPTVSPTTAPVVGSTLTATRGEWIAPDATAYAFQWLADGVPVSGATSTTYRTVSGDVGKKISVRVTGSAVGLTDGMASSVELPGVKANVSTTAKITVDASGKSTINVSCLKACSGYLQVRTSSDSTSAAATSEVVRYSVGAGSWASYSLTSVPLDVNPNATVRLAQSLPAIGPNPQFNAVSIVRAPGNVLKSSAKVTVSASGTGTVNVSCTMACSGYAQVWNDGTATGAKSNVFHYTLTKAGYTAMKLTGLSYVNFDGAKVRLAISSPKAFPDASPQFNDLQLVKG